MNNRLLIQKAPDTNHKLPFNQGESIMSEFIVNIIHRPEMAPEYAEKVTGNGKKETVRAILETKNMRTRERNKAAT